MFAVVVGGPRQKEDREEAPSWPPATVGCRVASAGIADLSSDKKGEEETGTHRRLGSTSGSPGCCWFRRVRGEERDGEEKAKGKGRRGVAGCSPVELASPSFSSERNREGRRRFR